MIRVDAESGAVSYSDDLASEIRQWMLGGVFGKTRPDAILYLFGQAKFAQSDGIECQLTRGAAAWDVDPSTLGTCMCGRLLMLLFDVSPEEISREKFAFLKALLEKGENNDQNTRSSISGP